MDKKTEDAIKLCVSCIKNETRRQILVDDMLTSKERELNDLCVNYETKASRLRGEIEHLKLVKASIPPYINKKYEELEQLTT